MQKPPRPESAESARDRALSNLRPRFARVFAGRSTCISSLERIESYFLLLRAGRREKNFSPTGDPSGEAKSVEQRGLGGEGFGIDATRCGVERGEERNANLADVGDLGEQCE